MIRCTCLKMACNSKMDGNRAKLSEFWDSGTLIAHTLVTFNLVLCKVILGQVCAHQHIRGMLSYMKISI